MRISAILPALLLAGCAPSNIEPDGATRLAQTDPRPGCTAPANFGAPPLQALDEFAGGLSSGVRPDYDGRNNTYQLLIRMGFDAETARAGATDPQVLHAALSCQSARDFHP